MATLYYSKPLVPPSTRKEGLLNFVQMIINRIEAGEHREALLQAVDLLDTLRGNANPYADVIDGISRPALDAELKAQAQQANLVRLEYGALRYDEGKRDARAEIAKILEGKL